jgi:hypothetical protein
MDHSKSYLALDQMIEKGWLVTGISDFAQVLHELEKKGHITREEHQSLLMRFMGKKRDDHDPKEESPGESPPVH